MRSSITRAPRRARALCRLIRLDRVLRLLELLARDRLRLRELRVDGRLVLLEQRLQHLVVERRGAAEEAQVHDDADAELVVKGDGEADKVEDRLDEGEAGVD